MMPLDQIRLRLRDHKAALWWVGVLFRQPRRLNSALSKIPRQNAIIGAVLYFHFLPYMIVFSVLGRIFLFYGLKLRTEQPMLSFFPEGWQGHALGIIFAVIFGVTFGGIASSRISNASESVVGWLSGVILIGVFGGVFGGIPFGIAFGTVVEDIVKGGALGGLWVLSSGLEWRWGSPE